MKNALIIFIKNIQPGKVKTRLAATVGNDRAVKIYKALLDRTRQEALKTNADLHVFYSSFIENNDEWKNDYFEKKIQHGENIGERMSNAFIDLIPPYEKVILIGGDIANITAKIIKEGFEKLNSHDFVLGPATDGGYYLIGQKKPTPVIFENITWSTDAVASQTLENIKSLGKTCYSLPALSDIDNEEDWKIHGWDI